MPWCRFTEQMLQALAASNRAHGIGMRVAQLGSSWWYEGMSSEAMDISHLTT